MRWLNRKERIAVIRKIAFFNTKRELVKAFNKDEVEEALGDDLI